MRYNAFQDMLNDRLTQFKNNIAIQCGKRLITYEELDKRSNYIANWILNKGIKRESFIGAVMDDRVESIIAMIGILKARCIFIPLNPADPQYRLEVMIHSANIEYIFIDDISFNRFPEIKKHNTVEFFPVDDLFWDKENAWFLNRPTNHYSAEDPIYIYFTSGTTGKPKAIMGKNKSLLHFINWEIDTFGIDESFRISQFTTPTFDAFLRDVFVPLGSGGLICIPESSSILLNSFELIHWINIYRIHLIHCVPGLFRLLNTVDLNKDHFKTLRFILLSGETIYPSDLMKWYDIFSDRVQLVNFYGPTETTMIKSYYKIRKSDVSKGRIPIGKPIKGARMIVCDEQLNKCDVLKEGEIYIRTPYRTLGYYRDPQLNKEKFIKNPYTKDPNDVLYKTRDLGRLLPDGNIELLGRMDRQIKIRGIRVELEGIEAVLSKHPSVKEAVVIKTEISNSNEILCGFITGIEKVIIDETALISLLKSFLSQQLPDYMIPDKLVITKEIPKRPNGKVDYDALHDWVKDENTDLIAPKDDIERKLLEFWVEILKNEKIGVNVSFFELGGNSLNIMSLLSKIYKEFDIRISLGEIFSNSTIEKQAEIVRRSAKKYKYTLIEAVEKKEYYNLSSAQKRLYMIQQMDEENTAYNIPLVMMLEGMLVKDHLDNTFQKLIRRHESLRTSFKMISNKFIQKIDKDITFKIEVYKASSVESGLQKSLDEIIKDFVSPFDLSQAPLLRVGLLAIEERKHILMIDMHHIITDGISGGILVKDFIAFYEGKELTELRFQYKDFSQWQNKLLSSEEIEKQKDYLLTVFAADVPLLNVPTDFERPYQQSSDGDIVNFEIGVEQIEAIKKYAINEDVTLFMLLLAFYNVLLLKISGQEDIVVGTAISGRKHTELEQIIGMFVNTLALRNYPADDKTFREFLLEVKKSTLAAFENQDYQFEALVEQLEPKLNRDLSRNPLFDAMFVLQNMENPAIGIPGLKLTPYELKNQTAKFDMTLTVFEEENMLHFRLTYRTKLFAKESILKFVNYFKRILSAVLESSEKKLLEIEVLSEEEKGQLLFDFNATDTGYPKSKTFHGLFEEQVEKTPDHTAVIFQKCHHISHQLTYKELNKKANQLARLLKIKGTKRDTITALMVEPSIEMMIGILAILKVGGAFMPIEPGSPGKRISYMLNDSKTKLLLTQKHLLEKVEFSGKKTNIEEDNIYEGGDINLNSLSVPTDLLYVIYTSGTTGKPKGTLIKNENLVNYINWFVKEIGLTGDDKAILTSSFAFDLGYTSIFPPFITGGELHIIPKETYLSAESLLDYIKINEISYLKLTPSLFTAIVNSSLFSLETCRKLRLVLLGGEPINLEDVERAHIHCKHIQIRDHYGPSETTIGSISQHIDFDAFEQYKKNPTIGRPIYNTKLYILDRNLRLLPIGISGELNISGTGLGRGYLNRPELTAEKFVENPYIPGERIYRTGDICRWLPYGSVKFQGRIDQQVKIRGYRVELAEIERHLMNHGDIADATILVRESDSGDKYLCAYIAPTNFEVFGRTPSMEQELRKYLLEFLPEYMIPSYFVLLDKIPLTPNGKVDRRMLPKPEIAASLKTSTVYAPPEDPLEKKLVELWEEILGVENIGVVDNFFQRGGHSLKAIILLSKIHKVLNVKVPMPEFFKTPTIRELSRYIKRTKEYQYTAIDPAEKKEYYTLSSAQKRLYFIQQLALENVSYNMPRSVLLEGPVEREKLERVIKRLIARHESLRTSFEMTQSEPVQKINEDVDFAIEYLNFKIPKVDVGERKKETEEVTGIIHIIDNFIRPFDLSQAPLLRVGLIKLEEEKHILLLDMHHIIADGTSMTIFIKDFMMLYSGKELPPLKLQYKDYSEWQNRLSKSDKIKKQEQYWLKQFEGDIPLLNMLTDYPRTDAKSFAGDNINFEIGKELSQRLHEMTKRTGVTLYMVLLAGYYILLLKYTGLEDIVVGAGIVGRSHADLENIVGMFINMLAMRNRPTEDKIFRVFLQEIKQNALDAYENQEYQFDELVKKLQLPRNWNRNPLFDTQFTFQNIAEKSIEIPGLKLKPFEYERKTMPFDLSLNGEETGDIIRMTFYYVTSLFKRTTVKGFVEHYLDILEQIVKNENIYIGDITISHEQHIGQLQFSQDEHVAFKF